MKSTFIFLIFTFSLVARAQTQASFGSGLEFAHLKGQFGTGYTTHEESASWFGPERKATGELYSCHVFVKGDAVSIIAENPNNLYLETTDLKSLAKNISDDGTITYHQILSPNAMSEQCVEHLTGSPVWGVVSLTVKRAQESPIGSPPSIYTLQKKYVCDGGKYNGGKVFTRTFTAKCDFNFKRAEKGN